MNTSVNNTSKLLKPAQWICSTARKRLYYTYCSSGGLIMKHFLLRQVQLIACMTIAKVILKLFLQLESVLTDSLITQNHSCLDTREKCSWKTTQKCNISLKALLYTKNTALGWVSQGKQLHLVLYLPLHIPPCAVFSVHMCSGASIITYNTQISLLVYLFHLYYIHKHQTTPLPRYITDHC